MAAARPGQRWRRLEDGAEKLAVREQGGREPDAHRRSALRAALEEASTAQALYTRAAGQSVERSCAALEAVELLEL
jgi:hypothetical protein